MRFTVACTTAAACPIEAVATTTEKLRNGKIVSLAKQKLRKRLIRVASAKVTIAAGATRVVTLKLNATGRKLLKRFKRMPVTLAITLLGPGGKKVVIKLTRLTLKAPKPQKGPRKTH
jgi:hypothetical protein